jgi:uncharacterized phosphosugar-binding protein
MENSPLQQYHDVVIQILDSITKMQDENLTQAAEILTDTTKNGGIIHTFGVGHSHLVAEDVFWRGATLANIHAILEPSLTGHEEITKSEYMEKIEGIGKIIVDYHRIFPPDVLVAISNSGNNAVPIEVAAECQKRGVKVIAITSLAYSDYLKTLHPSGKKLKDFANVVIDNCCPIGDAALRFDGLDTGVGALSTIAGSFIMHSILTLTVRNLLNEGLSPDVYFNGSLMANKEEVEQHNQVLIDKYFQKIRNL